jgi:glycosyltransferase involved in cell wall biosynthesis
MKIEIIGKFYSNHSLSIVNRNLAIELDKKGLDVFITPIDSFVHDQKLNLEQVKTLKRLESNSTAEPDVQIRHSYPPMWRYPVSKKTKVIYIQPWEYSRVPYEWTQKWESFADAVITPSRWTADKYLNAGVNPEKVFVIPNGYDPSIYNLEKEQSQFFDSKRFTFLFVGMHQARKGLDILLNIWKDCFVRADNVQLFIKDTPQIYGQNNLLSEILKMQYHTDCGKIIYNSDTLSDREMANIYKNTKAVVHPYRGEGFGMHVQEATACGALPIITAGGPTDEFIPDGVGFKIESQRQHVDLTSPDLFAVKPGDSLSGMGEHGWILEPNPAALKHHMRVLYSHHERKKFFEQVALYENPNTWDNIGNLYSEVIKLIYDRPHTQR